MTARALVAAYCVGMALLSRLVPLCPCCGKEVEIARLLAAIVWTGVAGWALLSRQKRFRLYGAIALLSAVQVANFWTQFVRYLNPKMLATWVVPAAALGACAFLTLAVAARRRPRTQ